MPLWTSSTVEIGGSTYGLVTGERSQTLNRCRDRNFGDYVAKFRIWDTGNFVTPRDLAGSSDAQVAEAWLVSSREAIREL